MNSNTYCIRLLNCMWEARGMTRYLFVDPPTAERYSFPDENWYFISTCQSPKDEVKYLEDICRRDNLCLYPEAHRSLFSREVCPGVFRCVVFVGPVSGHDLIAIEEELSRPVAALQRKVG